MPELLLIVARNEPALYERLRIEFEGDQDLSVVLDRRQGERRRPAAVPGPGGRDQRRADRRQALVVDQLRRFGWATVRAR